jgi:hypothetical protein
MKKLNLILIMGFIALLFNSCGPYVKLFETDATGTKKTDKIIAYEDESVIVTYNLWDNKGKMYYTVYNKKDIPIYVDWKKSGYILNSKKYNYWEDRTVSEAVNVVSYVPGTKIPVISTKTVATHDERNTFIPPKAWVAIPFSYILLTEDLESSYTSSTGKKIRIENVDLRNDKNATKATVNKTWKKSGKTKVWERTFTPETSPLNFRNFLTYTTTEDGKNESYVNTTFTIKKMTEMKAKQFYGKATKGFAVVKKGKMKKTVPVKFYDFPYKSGDCFYLNLLQ